MLFYVSFTLLKPEASEQNQDGLMTAWEAHTKSAAFQITC